MLYCQKEDLLSACNYQAILAWSKDDSRDTEEMINARIDEAIKRASEEVNLFVGKIYKLPFDEIPEILRDITIKISLYQLLSRKGLQEGSSDTIISSNRNNAIKKLEMISEGKISILGEKPDSVKIYRFFPNSYYKRVNYD